MRKEMMFLCPLESEQDSQTIPFILLLATSTDVFSPYES
jgi:hypothetical protein